METISKINKPQSSSVNQNCTYVNKQAADQTVARTTRIQDKPSGVKNNPNVKVYDCGITEEVVHGYVPIALNYQYSMNWGSYPQKDGRYGYYDCLDGKKNRNTKKVLSGIPDDVYQFLAETDRRQANSNRRDKEHVDYSRQFDDTMEDEITEECRPSALDIASYQDWLVMENKDNEVEDPIYPDTLLYKHFVPGEHKVNNQRWKLREQIIERCILNLTEKQKDIFFKYYGMRMTEAAIGMTLGVSKQAVSNILNEEIIAPMREVFTRLGFDVTTDEELKSEALEKREREKALKEAERERRADEREIRTQRAIANRYSGTEQFRGMRDIYNTEDEDNVSEEDFYKMEKAFEEETENERLIDDYDPDNPYDSVSDNYDPYEDSRYKEYEEDKDDYFED